MNICTLFFRVRVRVENVYTRRLDPSSPTNVRCVSLLADVSTLHPFTHFLSIVVVVVVHLALTLLWQPLCSASVASTQLDR
jgi:hypothetical protein